MAEDSLPIAHDQTDWQIVHIDTYNYLRKKSVPGGWIYEVIHHNKNKWWKYEGACMCFVPGKHLSRHKPRNGSIE